MSRHTGPSFVNSPTGDDSGCAAYRAYVKLTTWQTPGVGASTVSNQHTIIAVMEPFQSGAIKASCLNY
jgi:hypothetical protein